MGTGKVPVPLHVHSCYSPQWGVATPEELVERAASLGYGHLALTDRNGLYGLHVFLAAARESSVQFVVGAELTKNEERALCWVVDDTGYRDLCHALSELHCDPQASVRRVLAGRRSGLVVASDTPRVLAELCRGGREQLYVEVSPGHGMHRALAEARARSLPPLATVRAVGLTASDLAVHRVLRAVAGRSTVYRLDDQDVARPGDLLVGPARLIDYFPHCPDAVANTRRVAEACSWSGPDGQVVFPAFRGLSPAQAYQELRRRARDGVLRRYGGVVSDAAEQRLEKELGLIRSKGFASYFLVVEDIVRRSPRTCGRGSAAASLVAYALGITHVDPLRHNLFFERFLNPGRVDPPDIDVDFPWDERDAVLDQVFCAYGPRRVAMVANQVGFQWRGAVREVARAYGVPDAEIGRVARDLSHLAGGGRGAGGPAWTCGQEPPLASPWPEILEVAGRLSRHLRHLSVHCGGVVIAPDDMRNHAPVEVAAKGVPVIQWEKEQTEAAGLVKIDLLGNRSLAVIRDVLAAVEQGTGHSIDYAAWDPLADPATCALVRCGATMGCFYIESPATRLLLRRMWGDLRYPGAGRKDLFEHLVMASSIIRPAANAFIREFVARIRGAPWQALHPLLEPVLGETYGIAIYQEQITQVAMAMAGFTAQEGDELRKVLTKKHRAKRLADLAERFASGARGRGVPPAVVDRVWEQVLSFSGYSFCKPHSASYALVSLKCAYLKAHYPAEFLAAVLSNRGGYYVPFAYLSEARRLGLTVLPPCVNHSDVAYRGRGGKLRVGLLEVRGLSVEGRRAVVESRRTGGPFADLRGFLRRTGVGGEDARILARGGALDCLASGTSRSSVVMEVDVYFAKKPEADLFAYIEDQGNLEGFVPPPPTAQRLRCLEWETLGFPVSHHPLDPWRGQIRELARRGPPLVAARDLLAHAGRRVRTVGWWITGKVVSTRTRESMEFVSFEDTTSGYEATLFPAVYRRVRRQLTPLRPYLLQGRVEVEFGVPTLTVEKLGFLDGGRGG